MLLLQQFPKTLVLFPLAFPAVYETYNDVDCELGANFFDVTLYQMDPNNYLGFQSVAYSPFGGAPGGGLYACGDGFDIYEGITKVW